MENMGIYAASIYDSDIKKPPATGREADGLYDLLKEIIVI